MLNKHVDRDIILLRDLNLNPYPLYEIFVVIYVIWFLSGFSFFHSFNESLQIVNKLAIFFSG